MPFDVFVMCYSLLSAMTGSFLAAILDGSKPAIIVKPTLKTMSK
jgi:hypothetical protein